jgi:Flp pilus assembly protein TadG
MSPSRLAAIKGWGRRLLARHAIARQAKPRTGQAFIEFGLGSIALSLVLVGAADYARIFAYDVMISTAADAGVRAAANGAPDAEVRTAVRKSLLPGIAATLPDAAIRIAPAPAQRTAGMSPTTNYKWATVTVAYTFNTLSPLTAQHLSGSSTVAVTRTASQRMRVQCTKTDGTELPCT